jgi:thioesterase domain-containing protein
MAAEATVQLRGVRPRGPYILGGHSIGGLIAYEMAARLRRDGEEVCRVILFDATVPRHGLRFLVDELAWNLGDLRQVTLRRLAGQARNFVRNRRRSPRRGATESSSAHAEETLVALNRANRTALMNYRAAPSATPLAVLRTAQGTRRTGGDPALGWISFAQGGLSHRLVGGSHDTMFDLEHIDALTAAVLPLLELAPSWPAAAEGP